MVKDDSIKIQISEQIREDFKTLAELRGLKPAALLHLLVVNAINIARREHPELFKCEIPVVTLEEAKADDERKRAEDKEEE